MTRKPIPIQILGEHWEIHLVKIKGKDDGYCIPEDKVIQVHKYSRGKRRLELLVHEILHGADWWKDEEWIAQVAGNIAEAVCKLFELKSRRK